MDPAPANDTEIDEGGGGGGLKHLQDRMSNVKCIADEVPFNNPLPSLSFSVSPKKLLRHLFILSLLMNIVCCLPSSSPPTNTSGAEIAISDRGDSVISCSHSLCDDATSMLLLHINGSISRTVSLVANTLRIPLTVVFILVEIYEDVVDLTRELTFVLIEIMNIMLSKLIYIGTWIYRVSLLHIANILNLVQFYYGILLETSKAAIDFVVIGLQEGVLVCEFGRIGTLVSSFLDSFNVSPMTSLHSSLPMSDWSVLVFPASGMPPPLTHVKHLEYIRFMLNISVIASLLTLGLGICILLILFRQVRTPYTASITHHHHSHHYNTDMGLCGPSYHSSPMSRTDRFSNLPSGKGSTSTLTAADMNWEANSSFAYQADEVGQMTVTAFGTGVQPVSAPPDKETQPATEEEESLPELSEEEADSPGTEDENFTDDLPLKSTSNLESTPPHRLLRKIRASATWGEQGVSQNTTDDGDISSQSSASEMDQGRGRVKWIQEDGIYQLDRGKTSSLSLLQEYHDAATTAHLTKELADAIMKTCNPKNTERYKIVLEQGITPVHSDITFNKRGKPSKAKPPALSELGVNLRDDSELSSLVKSYFDKTSKQVAELFGHDVEFDRAIIHRMTGRKHKLPYCDNTSDTEGHSFSPTIAILSLGSTTASRAMFLKTATAGIVTNKVLLHPGSLSVLSGRAAAHYKFSMPREYGTEGEQFFIIFFQRTPSNAILEELQKIEVATGNQDELADTGTTPPQTPTSSTEGNTVPEVTETAVIGATADDKAKEDAKVTKTEAIGATADKKVEVDVPALSQLDQLRMTVPVQEVYKQDVSPHHKLSPSETPQTAIPKDINSFSFDFRDSIDIEPCNKLLLAETLEAVIGKMDKEQITAELMRNRVTTSGSLTKMRNRLTQTITMKIGEISAQPLSNMSIGMLQQPSPDVVPNNFINDVQKIVNCQDNIDKALVKVSNQLHQIQEATHRSKSHESVNKEAKAPSPYSSEELSALKRLFEDTRLSIISHTSGLKGTTDKILNLAQNLEESKSLLNDMIDTIRNCDKEMKEWKRSVFSDEATSKIDYIHEYVQKCYPTTNDISVQMPEKETEEETVHKSTTEKHSSWGDTEIEEQYREGAVTTPDMSKIHQTEPDLTLERALLKGTTIKVCLITDSIMRHIRDLESTCRHKYSFTRIDRRDSSGLCSPNTRDELKRQRPHIVYIHLGINDIHRGDEPSGVIDNLRDFQHFLDDWLPETRLVISLPLPNGHEHQERTIAQLRSSMALYASQRPSSTDRKRIYIQHNNNMTVGGNDQELRQNHLFFLSNDRVHLSDRGKSAMYHCFRGTLYRIFKGLDSERPH